MLYLAIVGMLAASAFLAGCGRQAQRAAAMPDGITAGTVPDLARFVDVSSEAGVRFRHTSGESGRYFLLESMGSGCAFLDYDSDGHLDLLFLNSTRLPGFKEKGPFYPALYRNEGEGQFQDVTRKAGLTLDCYGMGVAVADYDNDGDPDLLITTYGGPRLLRNDGGRFIEVTRQAGLVKPRWGTSAAWLDYDRDGHLDLFLCSYLDWTPAINLVCGDQQQRHACGPAAYTGTTSVLYRSKGDGTFTDVTRRAGVDLPHGKALGVVVWDLDDDGWLDFAVANDGQPNWLFRNNQDGTFTEIGVEAGVAYDRRGQARAGMGIDTADYDLSGRESLLIGNLSAEGLALFRPTGAPGQFGDVAEDAGLFQASLPFTTFGARFLDVDLDGFPDLLTTNGRVGEEVGAHRGVSMFEQRLQLFHNQPAPQGGRAFRELSAPAESPLNTPRVGRGLAVGDYDGDGDPDLLVSANNGEGALLRNERFRLRIGDFGSGIGGQDRRASSDAFAGNPPSAIPNPQSAHWLAVRLVGTKSNRDGIGARVRVTAGSRTQTGWVRSGGSYCSEDERVARFGLGPHSRVERLEVRWPSGMVERLEDVAVDRTLLIREGEAKG